MTSCTDFEPLLAERASGRTSGQLDPADAATEARLDAHLAGCEHCRAELAAWEQTFALARLPAPSDAERQALSHLPTRVRAELDRAPIAKGLGRILTLAFVAAAIVVVIANRLVIPGAEKHAAQPSAAAAAWQEPDPDALLQRIEKEHPELAVGSDNDLVRAEQLADAAYARAIEE